MTAEHLRAFDIMLGGGLTHQPVDNAKAVILLRSVQGEDRDTVLRMVLDARDRFRTWTTIVQRDWQRHTRRPSRARHHDSIEIRERYVRCA